MATCRTCTALGGYCEVTGRVFLGTILAFIHIPTAYTPAPGTLPDECQWHSERETPLLVDALAKAAQDLAMSISMDMVNIAADGGWTKQEASEVVEAWEAVRQVYHRYQKEVGDAKEAE